ncbi:hypothetical protein HDU67_004914 [Dinochytrium kinnereticum]|nr:hypothetical protein HDU67_004914 [Dinochytrium kinnereticum]
MCQPPAPAPVQQQQQQPAKPKCVDDTNIFQALDEKWDYDSTVSPGLEIDGAVIQKFPGSHLHVCVRPPRNLYERFAFNFIRDSRDITIFNMALRATLTTIPSAIFLIFFDFPWWWAPIHILLFLPIMGPYHLGLHVSLHRKVWKFDVMEQWYPVVLAPFFGQTFYTYYFHHIKTHPSLFSCSYFFRFFLLISIELPRYFFGKNEIKKGVLCFFGEYSGLALMTQHAFLERNDPLGGGLNNSITILDTPFNLINYNDGYHASHHLNAKRHWTEHPREFLRRRDEYIKSNAMVLKHCDYDKVWLALMFKRYDWIADYWWVHLDENNKISREEIIARLKEKTRAFSKEDVEKVIREKAAAKVM